MTRRFFAALAALIPAALMKGQAAPVAPTGEPSNLTTDWLGSLVAATPWNGLPGSETVVSTFTGLEIGLRSDGVVVWRKREVTR